jgi:hypothetical protein
MAQGQRSGIDSGMVPMPRRYQISDLAPYRKGDFLTIQVVPELYQQTGTFVDTESEIKAKRLPVCP